MRGGQDGEVLGPGAEQGEVVAEVTPSLLSTLQARVTVTRYCPVCVTGRFLPHGFSGCGVPAFLSWFSHHIS